jgi:hypothetical protein
MRDAGIATAGKKTHSFAGKEAFVSFLNDGHQLATIQPDRDFERNFPGRTFLDCRTGQAATLADWLLTQATRVALTSIRKSTLRRFIAVSFTKG